MFYAKLINGLLAGEKPITFKGSNHCFNNDKIQLSSRAHKVIRSAVCLHLCLGMAMTCSFVAESSPCSPVETCSEVIPLLACTRDLLIISLALA